MPKLWEKCPPFPLTQYIVRQYDSTADFLHLLSSSYPVFQKSSGTWAFSICLFLNVLMEDPSTASARLEKWLYRLTEHLAHSLEWLHGRLVRKCFNFRSSATSIRTTSQFLTSINPDVVSPGKLKLEAPATDSRFLKVFNLGFH